MEVFSIFSSIPAAFAICSAYCLIVTRLMPRFERFSRQLRFASYMVLTCFLIEVVLLITLGAVRSRGLLGPAFYVAHMLLFFSGPPALANSLLLCPKAGLVQKWYVAAVLCTVFAFILVLLQYGVSESLYGIDGDDGPYSGLLNISSNS